MLQSFDTHPKIEEMQISLIRQSNVAKRISRMCSLSQIIIQLSLRAVFRANPKLSEQELKFKFIAYHYGNELADRLRKYLDLRIS